MRDILQHRRLQHAALALAAAQDLGAGLPRFRDPAFQPLRGGFVDHRPEEGFRILGITGFQFPGG
jgi:hypothetical protein